MLCQLVCSDLVSITGEDAESSRTAEYVKFDVTEAVVLPLRYDWITD